ncbi:TetR/AcrR family transcriptional regulator [Streptomyces cyaneus]|uniref:TetR/AcrR family transcriptional regulator n=1 Tax=Streptomyces cyaneus TaxID=1904 RepID=UPI000FF894A3|nr:TetR/AcrR family transcriptional regulator [Streptomyces cyaneus]
MSSQTAPTPGRQRRATRATRARILEAARRELGRNPDSSLGDIAEAAGVARRTVYTHFAGRAALVEGLAAEAAEAVRLAVAGMSSPGPGAGPGPGPGPGPDPASALARFVLTLWPVGDCYRTLIDLAGRDLGPAQVREVLAPARETVAGILAEGRRQGVFHTAVPPGPLSSAIEAHLLALLAAVNSGVWADDGTGAATAALIATGVDRDTAAATVRRLHGTRRLHSPDRTHRPH